MQGTHGVMDTVIGNGNREKGSNPGQGCLHFTYPIEIGGSKPSLTTYG